MQDEDMKIVLHLSQSVRSLGEACQLEQQARILTSGAVTELLAYCEHLDSEIRFMKEEISRAKDFQDLQNRFASLLTENGNEPFSMGASLRAIREALAAEKRAQSSFNGTPH